MIMDLFPEKIKRSVSFYLPEIQQSPYTALSREPSEPNLLKLNSTRASRSCCLIDTDVRPLLLSYLATIVATRGKKLRLSHVFHPMYEAAAPELRRPFFMIAAARLMPWPVDQVSMDCDWLVFIHCI